MRKLQSFIFNKLKMYPSRSVGVGCACGQVQNGFQMNRNYKNDSILITILQTIGHLFIT